MTTRMLIDARHPEETRVAVLKNNRIDEFDFDSADHKQIKGNIYLAKVTRVEPSLQAAFVEFGGNRHGFLAFSEIHPDYYQIPKEDRDRLLAEEAAHAEEEAALRGEDAEEDGDDSGAFGGHRSIEDGDDQGDGHGGVTEVDTSEKDEVATIEAGQVAEVTGDEADDDENGAESGSPHGRRRQGGARAKAADEIRAKRMALRRRYKIQDVIHRRQVLLVQVVKEERGNKGAALTTYLSLAGRYCVLMPNSSHGGGISRKISSVADRKRLKSIVAELDLPRTMGCIVRTAGLSRTKPEIKRDFDYLARLWDEIRETTLKSQAPALIHSDSDLIKRAIRDIYNSEIEDIIVEGETGYRDARAFMKLLMPSHVRRVKAYADPVPLFQRYGAEDQLTALYDPVVTLKSGGYIVINPTEALVSIDINSGRSTKEYGIEATATNTNLEAAREIARQLRLRDMAGLVVIDFIDMEFTANIRKVEKAMKEALKNDRARIQIGRISSFGLMEMSRQRLRTGVLEATTRHCPHCDGSGLVRTAASAGLSALRLIEDEAARGRGTVISLFASQEAAVYVLNAKRAHLAEIEARYGVRVEVIPEGEDEGAKMRVVSSGPRNEFVPRFETLADDGADDDLAAPEEDDDIGETAQDEGGDEGGQSRRKRRKRRRGGRGRAEGGGENEAEGLADGADEDEADNDEDGRPAAADDSMGDGDGPRKRRRRRGRRRGGRFREDEGAEQAEGGDGDAAADAAVGETSETPLAAEEPSMPPEEVPTKPKRGRAKKAISPDVAEPEAMGTSEALDNADAAPVQAKRGPKPKAAAEPAATSAPQEEATAKPKRARKAKAAAEAAPAEPVEAETSPALAVVDAPAEAVAAAPAKPRRGWWQATFGG